MLCSFLVLITRIFSHNSADSHDTYTNYIKKVLKKMFFKLKMIHIHLYRVDYK